MSPEPPPSERPAALREMCLDQPCGYYSEYPCESLTQQRPDGTVWHSLLHVREKVLCHYRCGRRDPGLMLHCPLQTAVGRKARRQTTSAPMPSLGDWPGQRADDMARLLDCPSLVRGSGAPMRPSCGAHWS